MAMKLLENIIRPLLHTHSQTRAHLLVRTDSC